jgi:hypothetical protein
MQDLIDMMINLVRNMWVCHVARRKKERNQLVAANDLEYRWHSCRLLTGGGTVCKF